MPVAMLALGGVALGGVALGLVPDAALAHPGHGGAPGLAAEGVAAALAAGFAHPLGGLDHLLAGLAVGLIAALRGGRAVWLLPLAFLGMAALGAGLGMAGLHPPFVEAGILASLAVFGLLALRARRLPTALLAGLVGAFAVFHGLAHGAEMPEAASALGYVAGFLAATGLLHAAGLGLGARARRSAPAAASPRGIKQLHP